MSSNKSIVILINNNKCLMISILSVLCYWMTIFGDFVFDDTEAILNNKDVMNDTPMSQLFVNDFWGTKITDKSSHKSYRPLTVTVFQFIRRLNTFIESKSWKSTDFQLTPYLYHLFNIILYVITNILLFKVLNKLLNIFCENDSNFRERNEKNSFLVTILFSCHPIHSEVVCACVGLADLLSTLFALKALFIFIEFTNNSKQYNYVGFSINSVLVTLFCGIAMLFKEQGITFIGLCILFDLIIIIERPNTNCSKIVTKLLIYRMVCLCSGALLLLILRFKVMNFSGPQFQSGDNPTSFENLWSIRTINYNYIYAINAWILVYPEWLCFDWSMDCIPLIKNFTDFRIFSVISFWIISLLLIKSSLFHQNSDIRRQIQISLAFGFVTFIPSSNIFFSVGFVVAERTLFLPSIGYLLLLMTGINLLEKRFNIQSKTILLLIVFLVLIFTFRAFNRSIDWMNERQLFESGLNVCPSNAKIHYNIAKNAADSGLKQKAIQEYREAIRLRPEYDHALNNLANIFKDSGDFIQSKQLLEKAVKIRPSFAAAWMNLAIIQMTLNQYSDAEISYFNALKHRSRYAECYYNLGNLYVKQNRFEEAFRVWRNATLIKPKLLSTWNNLIIMLDSIGSYENAEKIALEALKHHTNQSSLHFNFANVLGKMKKFNESENQFKIAISLSPENANYYSNLAVLYHQSKHYSNALFYYEKALKIDPNLKSTQKNLNMLLKKLNQ